MAREATFKKWIIQNASKDWMFQTIETSTGSGVPDIFMCVNGCQAWIETKATDSNKCYMRISQWRWFYRLCTRGGFGLLIIKREKTRQADVYIARDLTQLNPHSECELKGDDVIFPPDIKPAFSYKLGTGNGMFYKKLLSLLERNFNE